MARTLVVVGTPLAGSFTHALAERYVAALLAAGVPADDVRVVDLATDPVPAHPTTRADLRAPDGATDHLPDDVAAYTRDLTWAEHVVVLFPQWWGTSPAALTAWIDRVVLSGVAFRYGRGHVSERLLTGRTARIVMTMDSPGFWNRFVYRDAAVVTLRRATFAYVGIRTVGVTRLAAVRFSAPERREAWLAAVERAARKDARLRSHAPAELAVP